MKKINEILVHLKSNPNFKKINTSSQIEQIIQILDPRIKKGIKFAYIKDDILYFVLTHSVFKYELDCSKEHIKSSLKKVPNLNIKDIISFVTNKKEIKKTENKTIPTYQERSYGIFENTLKDEKLFEKFEEIRELIKNS